MNEKQNIIHALKTELYKKSFYEFVKRAVLEIEPTTKWDWNWHIEYLCSVLQSHAIRVHNKEQGNPNVCINVPFRSMKTLVTGCLFQSWLWTWFPTAKVMVLSHSESLAIHSAYLAKILMRSEWYKEYFPDVKLMGDDAQKGSYTNVYGGKRLSFGITAGVTGQGADFQIIDDGNKVGESKKVLESTNETYSEMVFNRVQDLNNCCRINLQQRIAQNDLSGYLLKKGGWDQICIPAVLSNNLKPAHLVEHYVDGLFWVTRFNRAMLRDYGIALGTRGYNSQLMQQTSSDGGNILKEQWFDTVEYVEKLHGGLSWELIVDPAYGKGQDPTGLMICAKLGNDLIVKKCWAVDLSFPELIKEIQRIAITYKIRRIFCEPKASGISIIQQLRTSTKLNVVELPNHRDDKETRCNAISPSIEGRRVKLLDGAYIKDAMEEWTNFPLAAHDDMTDCLIYAVEKFINKGRKFNYGM